MAMIKPTFDTVKTIANKVRHGDSKDEHLKDVARALVMICELLEEERRHKPPAKS
jgi:hypothetical protein